jgi:hypothetical protein
MSRTFARLLLVLVPTYFVVSVAFAHDQASWILRGGLKNAAGEWCCGEGDCFAIPSEQVSVNGAGYRLYGLETVPFNEVQPSPDGVYWRCKRPDGTRRCFFAPPPSG